MEQKKYEELVENLFLIMPLLKKKLVKYDLYGDELDLNPSHFHISLTEDGKDFFVNHKALVINALKTKISKFDEEDLQKLSSSLQNLKELLNRVD